MEQNINYAKLNLGILSENYTTKGNTTTCTLKCKINLKEFERQNFCFNNSFIRKIVSEHLPVIKTIYNYNLDFESPVVGKFYIVPGRDAKVLEYDESYYRLYRKYPENKILKVGDYVKIKDIPGVYKNAGEIDDYDYCDVFTVTGNARCKGDDVQNTEVGNAVALNKAMNKAANRIYGLLKAIVSKMTYMADNLNDSVNTIEGYIERLSDIRNGFINADVEAESN